MGDILETLHQNMEAAVRALDFEEAKGCSDKISAMRGGVALRPARRFSQIFQSASLPPYSVARTNKHAASPLRMRYPCRMDLINLLLVPLIGIAAYYAFASAYGYARRRNMMNTAWTTAAGLLLAGCALYLIARAVDL